jgi:hypothetical protein
MSEIRKVIVRIDGEWWGFDGEDTTADNFGIFLADDHDPEPWLEINGKAIRGVRLTQVMFV